MEHCKLQAGCLIVVLYIAFIYFKEQRAYGEKGHRRLFEALLFTAVSGILFDGITAYTVNHLEEIPAFFNSLMHMCFLISLDAIVFLMYLYMRSITRGLPKKKIHRRLMLLPFVCNVAIVVAFLDQLTYRQGKVTNYSMGVSAYTCFAMVAVYTLLALLHFLRSFSFLERRRRVSIATYLAVIIGVAGYQMLFPEALISCLVPTIAVLGAYLNQENPVFMSLRAYHREMVMGFATLVENRDSNTGGHIHRTTAYVELLAGELKERGFYRKELTRDYINNLILAAPMHDVGKIAIPDSILQKPGRLTEEEFAVIKTHTERGGRIIQETFGHIGEAEYQEMAYEVARHHHEKWNGKGYPDGLAGKEIPLCARIMAIADVFDAISAKRCYRDAMPLAECYRIISEGSGQDFDPLIADVFLDMKDKIEAIMSEQNGGSMTVQK